MAEPNNEPSNEAKKEPQPHKLGTMEYIILACVAAFVLLGIYRVIRSNMPAGTVEQIAPPEGPTPSAEVSSTTSSR
jgi:hypothetical protein